MVFPHSERPRAVLAATRLHGKHEAIAGFAQYGVSTGDNPGEMGAVTCFAPVEDVATSLLDFCHAPGVRHTLTAPTK